MEDRQKLSIQKFYDCLIEHDVSYFCGVPDSVVGPFSKFVAANHNQRHIIAANEGNAIGLAIGYHVATSKLALIYMQNSGLGNAIDPLVSLADESVLSVPMLLLVGWRGQPGTGDEPQHAKQGAITTELLEIMGIPYLILSRSPEEMKLQVKQATQQAIKSNMPFALIVQRATFDEYKSTAISAAKYPLTDRKSVV